MIIKNLKNNIMPYGKSPAEMGHSPAKMESAKQEKKNLLTENPIDDKGSALAMKGSWMSKHCKSALHMGHKDSPAKKHCM
jgi:hypothetical protein